MKKAKIFLVYPILLFIIGIAIHIQGLYALVLRQQAATLWEWWVHLFMLAFNSFILVGLLLQKRAASIIAAVGLLALILFQGIVAVLANQITLLTIFGWVLSGLAVPMLVYRNR